MCYVRISTSYLVLSLVAAFFMAACNGGGESVGGGAGAGSSVSASSISAGSSLSSSLPAQAQAVNSQLNQSSSYQLTSGDIDTLQSEGVLGDGDQAVLGQLAQ